MRGLVEIKEDVFDIVERIKGINDNYKIFFNKLTNKFELHVYGNKPSKQLDIPFEKLDYRTIDYILSTRLEKILEEILEIDMYNNELYQSKIDTISDEAARKTKDLYNYLRNGGCDCPSYDKL